MTKVAIIGAGGFVFPLRLIGDLLACPELQDVQLALMDIDEAKLAHTEAAARELVTHHALPARIEATTDRKKAVSGADFVIVTFQVGGLEAYRFDVEVPRRYGLDQCVGDTLGPGGVFRFLRSAPAYRDLAADIKALCPDALLLNYANPMAMSCLYLSRLGIKTVGLCHSVQGTTHMLADALGVPYDEVHYRVAGINHQAWVLDFRRDQEDLYPELRAAMNRAHLGAENAPTRLETDRGDHSEVRGVSTYEGGQERVRTQMMATFGYFHTESSHHASEYVPYFRKNAALVEQYIPARWDYLEVCESHDDADQVALLARLKEELKPSLEYGAKIVQAAFTGVPTVIYGNVPNTGLIPNLPEGCCVEVACLVDQNGVQPTRQDPLPPQLAALNRTNIGVQELAVEAALTGKLEHVVHAVALDPLTSALLTLEQIHSLVEALLGAEAPWLQELFPCCGDASKSCRDSFREVINRFEPGAVWYDTDGVPIQAHGGGVLFDQGTYYWFGQNLEGKTYGESVRRVDAIGISCYASTDLYNWTNKGVVLPAVRHHPDLGPSGVLERPKVIYNDRTGQFVMWLHIDHADYTYARTGVAVAASATGPYRFIKSFAPAGHDSRDMTVFQDGAEAYLLFSSEWNKTLKIAALSEDGLNVTEPVTRHFIDQSREAPAVFKRQGLYYLITSGCTGWASNEAQYAVTDTVQGAWEIRGSPCRGPDAEKTFEAQVTFVLQVADRDDAFIVMMDRWNKDDLTNSRYVWLPAKFHGDKLVIDWLESWDLSVFDAQK